MPDEDSARTTVVNLRDFRARGLFSLTMANAVLIDRRTPWGNPFPMDNGNTRDEVVNQFDLWVHISDDPKAVWIRDHIHALKGKRLACHCAPLACHGDILAEMADAT